MRVTGANPPVRGQKARGGRLRTGAASLSERGPLVARAETAGARTKAFPSGFFCGFLFFFFLCVLISAETDEAGEASNPEKRWERGGLPGVGAALCLGGPVDGSSAPDLLPSWT